MTFKSGAALRKALLQHKTVRLYHTARHGRAPVGELKVHDGRRYLLLLREEPHFYVKKQSLGMDTSVLTDAMGRGALTVVIAYTGRAGRVTVYLSPIELWRDRGFEVSYPDFDAQVQLPVRLMQTLEEDV